MSSTTTETRVHGAWEKVHVRRADAADVATVARLDAACFERPWSTQELLSLLTGDTLLLIAELQGGAVGYCLARQVLETADLLRIAVCREARRKGIARQLLTRTRVDLERQNCETLILEVSESNRPARELYTRFGFTVVGRRENYYPTSRTGSGSTGATAALVMSLRLATTESAECS